MNVNTYFVKILSPSHICPNYTVPYIPISCIHIYFVTIHIFQFELIPDQPPPPAYCALAYTLQTHVYFVNCTKTTLSLYKVNYINVATQTSPVSIHTAHSAQPPRTRHPFQNLPFHKPYRQVLAISNSLKGNSCEFLCFKSTILCA